MMILICRYWQLNGELIRVPLIQKEDAWSMLHCLEEHIDSQWSDCHKQLPASRDTSRRQCWGICMRLTQVLPSDPTSTSVHQGSYQCCTVHIYHCDVPSMEETAASNTCECSDDNSLIYECVHNLSNLPYIIPQINLYLQTANHICPWQKDFKNRKRYGKGNPVMP